MSLGQGSVILIPYFSRMIDLILGIGSWRRSELYITCGLGVNPYIALHSLAHFCCLYFGGLYFLCNFFLSFASPAVCSLVDLFCTAISVDVRMVLLLVLFLVLVSL